MDKIIVMFKDVDTELNMSLYEFIKEQYRHSNSITVCNVTKDEYKIMLKQIQHGCLNERLPRVTNETIGYDKYRYLMAYDIDNNNIAVANCNNYDQIGSYYIDNDGIHYVKNGLQFPKIHNFYPIRGIKIYTTETYEDVINHYELLQNKEYLIEKKTNELINLIGKSCKTCNTKCCGGLAEACYRWTHIIK
jgi:hypothetical protein